MLFILTTTLLSIALWGIYHFFLRTSSDLWIRKTYLYFLIASITFLGGYTLYLSFSTIQAAHSYAIWEQIPASVLKEFCNCQNPSYKHKILYRSQTLFSVYETSQPWVQASLWIGFILSLLHTLSSCFSLQQLSQLHKGEHLNFGNKKFSVIPARPDTSVGVFSWKEHFLLWPDSFRSLSSTQQRAILAHEASHIDQRNTLELILLSAIRSISWFNPIYYILKNELVLISELRADQEGVKELGDPLNYARLILNLQQKRSHAFIQHMGKHPLSKRISYLLACTPKEGLQIRKIWMAYLFSLSLVWATTLINKHYSLEYQKFSHLSQQLRQQAPGGFSCDGCAEDLREFRRIFKTEQEISPNLSTPPM